MLYQLAQVFYIDPKVVLNQKDIYLSNIQLFFRQKPPISTNLSGHVKPGCSISIAPITLSGAASINSLPGPNTSVIIADSYSRVEWDYINTSTDSNTPTIFSWEHKLPLEAGQYYAVLIHFDSPEFILWYEKANDPLLNTTSLSPGPTDKNVGNFYELGSAQGGTSGQSLTPLTSQALKFIVNIAQFNPAANLNLNLTNGPFEFLNTNGVSNTYIGGEYVYQDLGGNANGTLSANVTFYDIGTINVSTNSYTVVGNGTVFTNSTFGFINGSFMVITDGTAGNTFCAPIASVTNNTLLILNILPRFNNSAAYYKKTVVGNILHADYTNNTIMLANSTANSTVLFTPNLVGTFLINAGGSGYNNTDFVTVYGSVANAQANVSTNSTGGIVGLNIVNAGSGTITPANLTILAANGTASSNGSSGNVTCQLGPTLRGEISGSYANISGIYDFRVDDFTPEILVKMPDSSTLTAMANFSNAGHVVNTSSAFSISLDSPINSAFDCYVLSRSTEVVTATANLANIANDYKSSYVQLTLNAVSNSSALFSSPYLYTEKIDMVIDQIQINNNDTNEEMPQNGNAISRHITENITFANNKFANSVSVVTSTYVPINTSISLFAKLFNSTEGGSFQDKYWTRLNMISGNGQISSSSNTKNVVQFTYALPAFPPSSFTCPGTITIASGNAVVLTTTDLTANIANGTLIKLYNPAPTTANGDYIVTVAVSVNTTAITCSSNTTNSIMLGSGFYVDVLNWPQTAFADAQNSNAATYFNGNLVPLVSFNMMAIKACLLSPNTNIYPKITELRVGAI